jgi:hypothetical protein
MVNGWPNGVPKGVPNDVPKGFATACVLCSDAGAARRALALIMSSGAP